MNVLVFLGPSLPVSEARRILPTATYRPPARQGDVVSCLSEAPTAIALIDGEFHQARSVWHKELLLALDRGVHVFGASSMGALRAAELEAYGMFGVGSVFEQYAAGRLVDDDEVALVYHQEDGAYGHLSEPMVNIRATLAAAEEAGAVSAAGRALAEAHAKALPYAGRTRTAVLHRLRSEDLPTDEVDRLADFWRTRPVDVKAEDARRLLSLLRQFSAAPPPPRASTFDLAHTTSLDTLYDRERTVPVADRRIALADIADFVQVHHPHAARITESALDEALVETLAQLLEFAPTAAEVNDEIARWRVRHGYQRDADLADWQRRNHLTSQDFRELASGAAARRAMRRWLIYSRHVERITRPVLDHLRWTDEYEGWAAAAARHHTDDPPTDAEVRAVVAAPAWWTGHPMDADLATLAEEAGFHTPLHLASALAGAMRVRRPGDPIASVTAEQSAAAPQKENEHDC